jgi:hypothetical protein
MADFYQTGLVATVHRLGNVALEKIEADLLKHSRVRPIALVLPSLAAELEQPALKGILEELKKVRFLKQIVVTMGGTGAEQFRQAKKVFGQLPQKPAIIWNTGPRLEAIYQKLEANGLPAGDDGKGRSCWLAYGYVLATVASPGSLSPRSFAHFGRSSVINAFFIFWTASDMRWPGSLPCMLIWPASIASPMIGGWKSVFWPKFIATVPSAASAKSTSATITSTSIKLCAPRIPRRV